MNLGLLELPRPGGSIGIKFVEENAGMQKLTRKADHKSRDFG